MVPQDNGRLLIFVFGLRLLQSCRPVIEKPSAPTRDYRTRGVDRCKASPNRSVDVQTVKGLTAGRNTPQLPVFGCATSEKLREQLDPFGLKHG
jgi:hypothetical protein